MQSTIKSKQVLGILGAGQLAKMTGQVAQRLGLQVAVYNNRKSIEPASAITKNETYGSWEDLEAMIEFAKGCHALTLENEFISAEILEIIQNKSGTPIYPAPESFKLIEDKITQKSTFQKAGLPVSDWKEISTAQELIDLITIWQSPLIVKLAKGGYDGLGNYLVTDKFSAVEAIKLFENKGRLLAEKKINLKAEYAVCVASNGEEIEVYPVVETIQENHICTHVICPANISSTLESKIQQYALKFIETIKGRGVYSLEFFLDESDQLWANEPAPRPHNSAHLTIEACQTSQFENHVRAVMGYPLGKSKLLFPNSLMINLLGDTNGDTELTIPESLWKQQASIHLYGKLDCKKGRKMGHITLCGETSDELQKHYQNYRKEIKL